MMTQKKCEQNTYLGLNYKHGKGMGLEIFVNYIALHVSFEGDV